jgi:hypothetical protein
MRRLTPISTASLDGIQFAIDLAAYQMPKGNLIADFVWRLLPYPRETGGLLTGPTRMSHIEPTPAAVAGRGKLRNLMGTRPGVAIPKFETWLSKRLRASESGH